MLNQVQHDNILMNIYGYLPTSLIEWPGKVSSVIFTGGCNVRRPYCQNGELIDGLEKLEKIPLTDVLKDLKLRRKWVDAVCWTGGEPTLQEDLLDVFASLKKLGFLIQLETNGTNSAIIKRGLKNKLIDRITMDVKTSVDVYSKAVGVKVSNQKILQSIELIKQAEIDNEFRTTVVPGIVGKEEIEKIGVLLSGAKKIVLQQFRNKDVSLLDKKMAEVKPYSANKLNEFAKILRKSIKKVEVKV